MSDDQLTVRYQTGPATMVAFRGCVALIHAPLLSPACAIVEQGFTNGASFGELAEALSGLGFSSLPPLAVVVNEGTSVHILQRGQIEVAVVAADGTRTTYAPPTVSTWREELVHNCGMVRLTALGMPQGDEFWIAGAGTAPCSTLSWSPKSPAHSVEASTSGVASVADPAPAAVSAAPEPLPEAVEQVREAERQPEPEQPEPEQVEEPEGGGVQIDNDSTLLGFAPSSAAPGDVSAAAEPVVAPAVAAHAEVTDLDFSNLIEHTIYRNVEDAAVRVVGPAGSEHASPPSTPAGPTPGKSDVIMAVPSSGAPPVSPLAPATPLDDPDHDGHTVARRGKSKRAANPAAGPARTLMAVRCVAGHVNPTNATKCRMCDQPITDRTPHSIPRPTLGYLRFSSGHEVPINGPIVIGRIPAATELDGESAVLVAIDNSELSRTHATIHVADWFVYVADSGSTNGTQVIVPGIPPETCRLQERIQITPGTVVDLGGAVTFRFDVS